MLLEREDGGTRRRAEQPVDEDGRRALLEELALESGDRRPLRPERERNDSFDQVAASTIPCREAATDLEAPHGVGGRRAEDAVDRVA